MATCTSPCGAVDHGVLVADGRSFRFRHPLLAEAVYATVLPGERERLHGRLAEELERAGTAGPAELATHWAAAGRHAEALVASVEAARRREAVFALAEARAHVERALELWDLVPNAADLVPVDRGGLCAWAAEIASSTGAGPRAVELAERAIDRRRATHTGWRTCTAVSAATSTRAAAPTPRWRRASGWWRSSRHTRRRPSGRGPRRPRPGACSAGSSSAHCHVRAGAGDGACSRRLGHRGPCPRRARQRPRLPRPRRGGARSLRQARDLAEAIGEPIGLLAPTSRSPTC